ncbi:MAG TPA: acyl-CoA dehydrogenase family protein [Solirubrobacteraceae bacterium]|jgi:acyl-CoA dehydrogenase|nr:acyl-CoA dehydrogenase family protein [Solirubrobacteraceae bacterium]
MDFAHSPRTQELLERLIAFQEQEIAPREEPYMRELLSREDPWVVLPAIEELKAAAKQEGLWNLFLPDAERGGGLSNIEYAPLAERMGRSLITAEVCNCNAPDTGNMEVLWHFGSEEQKQRWLEPLLDGRIRSAFCMTEPEVASSDATNMQATAVLDGDEVVVNGTKWWSTGVGHPNCQILIFMGLTTDRRSIPHSGHTAGSPIDPQADRYHQHSMVLVPMETPGVKVERMLEAMGFLDAPGGHGEVSFTDVRLPASAIIGGAGQAFAIAQARLGPGRIHHCMRLIGLAELALELACKRAGERMAFGKPIANLGGNRERIADARIAIDRARLHVLHAAWLVDQKAPEAIGAVSQIKVATPNMAQGVVDMAIQLHGGGGLSNDFPLAGAWTAARALRLADGPDEVHRGVIARLELARYGKGKWSG